MVEHENGKENSETDRWEKDMQEENSNLKMNKETILFKY
jgi:hypothetical protein